MSEILSFRYIINMKINMIVSILFSHTMFKIQCAFYNYTDIPVLTSHMLSVQQPCIHHIGQPSRLTTETALIFTGYLLCIRHYSVSILCALLYKLSHKPVDWYCFIPSFYREGLMPKSYLVFHQYSKPTPI